MCLDGFRGYEDSTPLCFNTVFFCSVAFEGEGFGIYFLLEVFSLSHEWNCSRNVSRTVLSVKGNTYPDECSGI